MPYKKGDVVLVPFPFSDSATEKKRPAVIIQCDALNNRLDTVTIAQVTSNISRAKRERSQVFVDIATTSGRETGMLMDSAVKCETIATIAKSRIIKTIGRLDGGLKKELDKSLRAAFDL